MSESAAKKRYLVLCTANRCRSQMAHGWLAHLGGDAVDISSAGAKPKGVHPLSIEVMDDAGVDITGHSSDHLEQYLDQDFDAVITVCDNAQEACPVFPGAKRMVHHAFDDPDDKTGTLTADQMRPTFVRVREEIRRWCAEFLAGEGVPING